MFRLLSLVVLLIPAVVFADPPQFSKGGFNFAIQYGPGFWTMDKVALDAQLATSHDPGGGTQFVNDLPSGASHALNLGIAYNILGHASVGADLTANGWNISEPKRGGAGFVIGKVAWHPLELVFLNKEARPIPLDVSTFFGLGYGIVGGGREVNPRGMDGLIFEWGANVDWFFTRFFGVGFFARGVFFNWDKLYQDFNNKVFVQLSKPSGGSFWTFGLTLTFRAGE